MLEKDTNKIKIELFCGCKYSLSLFFHPNDMVETLKRYDINTLNDKITLEMCEEHKNIFHKVIIEQSYKYHLNEKEEFNNILRQK